MRLTIGHVCLLLGVCASACDDDLELKIRDTEGRQFAAKCDREGNCAVKQVGGPKWPGADVLRLESPGRLVGICSLDEEEQQIVGSECRALACKKNSECPPIFGMKYGSCIGGLCGNAANEVTQRDAIMHCLRGTGLGDDSKEQVDRFALAANCGTPCEIPKICSFKEEASE